MLNQMIFVLMLGSRVIRKRRAINHHLFSSIWSSIKDSYSDILENSSWLLGIGDQINFCTDEWCGQPLCHSLNIPAYLHNLLTEKVEDFIANNSWCIPTSVHQLFPNLGQLLCQVIIPMEPKEDHLLWKTSPSGI